MPRRTSTTTGLMRIALVATCWVAACSACLLHGGRSAVRPRAAPRLMATASADLELEMAWCARIVREAADMLAAACVDTHVPGASVLYVRATRTSLLRTRGTGQLAPYAHTSLGRAVLIPRTVWSTTSPGPPACCTCQRHRAAWHCCTHAVHIPASGVPYVYQRTVAPQAEADADAANQLLEFEMTQARLGMGLRLGSGLGSESSLPRA